MLIQNIIKKYHSKYHAYFTNQDYLDYKKIFFKFSKLNHIDFMLFVTIEKEEKKQKKKKCNAQYNDCNVVVFIYSHHTQL